MYKIAIISVAIVLLVGGIVFYQTNKLSFLSSATQVPTTVSLENKPQDASNSVTPLEGGTTIHAQDQSDGDVLTVDLAVLEKPGFIVLQKVGKDGKNTIAGRSDLLKSGQYQSTDIDISPLAKKGDTYVATLFEDTDGNGTFNQATDKQIIDAQGKTVASQFTINKTDTPPPDDTTSTPDSSQEGQ